MPAHIRVFDDSEDILELLQTALEAEGYAVTLHRSPQEALWDAAQAAPDLIILDWLFRHGERGLHLLQRLQAQPSTAPIPVVICTAEVFDIQGYEALLRTQGVTILYKPFHLDDLLAVIKGKLLSVQ